MAIRLRHPKSVQPLFEESKIMNTLIRIAEQHLFLMQDFVAAFVKLGLGLEGMAAEQELKSAGIVK
jgi:hypothetical protein